MSDAFIQALADSAEEGLIDLQALRATCLAKVMEGGGEVGFITNATLNGQGANQECKADATQLLAAVNRAIHLTSGRAVSMTYIDFSGLR